MTCLLVIPGQIASRPPTSGLCTTLYETLRPSDKMIIVNFSAIFGLGSNVVEQRNTGFLISLDAGVPIVRYADFVTSCLSKNL